MTKLVIHRDCYISHAQWMVWAVIRVYTVITWLALCITQVCCLQESGKDDVHTMLVLILKVNPKFQTKYWMVKCLPYTWDLSQVWDLLPHMKFVPQ